ncbi:MAG: hypothetical protein LC754_11575 [Acidobacteria bacterium]|nr:hypothetical protein [Acidobacteriota bacterium]
MRTKLMLTISTALVSLAARDTGRLKAQQPHAPNRAKTGWMRRMLNTLLASLTLAALSLGSVSAKWADVTCEAVQPAISVVKVSVTYYGPLASTPTDLRADPDDATHTVKLKGLLYYPSGTVRDAPVIIFNHGHEQDRGEPSAVAEYFVRRGFVVFAPLRRGHFYESDFRSTGVHIDRYVNKCQRSQEAALASGLPQLFCGSVFCRQAVACSDPHRANALEVGYLREQSDDVREQIRFIREQPAVGKGASGKLVDPRRIAILGHSFGGALVIFANAFDYGQNVAVDVSGAELSWSDDSPFWESDLGDTMNNQSSPVYFLQPGNGRSLLPTKTLFGKAVSKGYRAQAAIFPPVPWDPVCREHKRGCWDSDKNKLRPEWRQAHNSFIGRGEQVGLWGCSVIEFVNRYPLP